MYGFDIIIENKNFKEKHDKQYEDWIHSAYDYVYHLERTGQILKTNGRVIVNENTVSIAVVCPELDSMDRKNCSPYNKEIITQIEKNASSTIKHHLKGRDADYQNYKLPEKTSFYLLRTGWASPLLCGDTHQPIPLYKISATDHSETDYDNIYFWNQNYERLKGLWLSSGKYEEFAEQQLQDPFSSINKSGRELCALIEKLTGVPTYYFLHNYRPWSKEKDKQRKCPITGNDWYIKGKTETDFIAFKCDESRLVSELSTNSSESQEPLKRSVFELNGKMLDFTIEAVDFRIKTKQALMADKKNSKNDYSDLVNDNEWLKIIRESEIIIPYLFGHSFKKINLL